MAILLLKVILKVESNKLSRSEIEKIIIEINILLFNDKQPKSKIK